MSSENHELTKNFCAKAVEVILLTLTTRESRGKPLLKQFWKYNWPLSNAKRWILLHIGIIWNIITPNPQDLSMIRPPWYAFLAFVGFPPHHATHQAGVEESHYPASIKKLQRICPPIKTRKLSTKISEKAIQLSDEIHREVNSFWGSLPTFWGFTIIEQTRMC